MLDIISISFRYHGELPRGGQGLDLGQIVNNTNSQNHILLNNTILRSVFIISNRKTSN